MVLDNKTLSVAESPSGDDAYSASFTIPSGEVWVADWVGVYCITDGDNGETYYYHWGISTENTLANGNWSTHYNIKINMWDNGGTLKKKKWNQIIHPGETVGIIDSENTSADFYAWLHLRRLL